MDHQPPRRNTNPFIDSTEDSINGSDTPNVLPVDLNSQDFGINQWGVGVTEGDGFSSNVDYNMGLNSAANGSANGASNGATNGLPNVAPNAAPNAAPNPFANATPNPFANTTPNPFTNTTPNPFTNTTPNPFANTTPNPFANTTPNPFANTTPNPFTNTTPNPFTNTTPNAVPNYDFNYGANSAAQFGQNFNPHIGVPSHDQGNMTSYLVDSTMFNFIQAVVLATTAFLSAVRMNRHMVQPTITKNEFDVAVFHNFPTQETTPSGESEKEEEISYSPLHNEENNDQSDTLPLHTHTEVHPETNTETNTVTNAETNTVTNAETNAETNPEIYPLLGDVDYEHEPFLPDESEGDIFDEEAEDSPDEGEYEVHEAEIQNLMNISYDIPADRYLTNPFDELSNQAGASSGARRRTYQPPNYGEVYEGAQFVDKYQMSNVGPYFINNGNRSRRSGNSESNNYGYAHAPYADIFRHPNYANMYRATNYVMDSFLSGTNENTLEGIRDSCSHNSADDSGGANYSGDANDSGDANNSGGANVSSGSANIGEQNIDNGYDDSEFAHTYQGNNYEITDEGEVADPFENVGIDNGFDFGSYENEDANGGEATTTTTGSTSQGHTVDADGITNGDVEIDEGDNGFGNTEKHEPSSEKTFLTEPVKNTPTQNDTINDDHPSLEEINVEEKQNSEVSEQSQPMGHPSNDDDDEFSEYEKYVYTQSGREDQKNYNNIMGSYLKKYKKVSENGENEKAENGVGSDAFSPQDEESPDDTFPGEEKFNDD